MESKGKFPNGACSECRTESYLASNGMCGFCLKERGLKECKKCRFVGTSYPHFPKGAVCSDCKQKTPYLPRTDQAENSRLLRQYGICLEDKQAMEIAQDGKCAICGAETKLVIDHDHRTSKVRGLVCQPCNLGLGGFKDSPANMHKAAEYLGHTHQETLTSIVVVEPSARIKRLEFEVETLQRESQWLKEQNEGYRKEREWGVWFNREELRAYLKLLHGILAKDPVAMRALSKDYPTETRERILTLMEKLRNTES